MDVDASRDVESTYDETDTSGVSEVDSGSDAGKWLKKLRNASEL